LFCGRCALTEKLWNCKVESPSFTFDNWLGTRDSRLWHNASPLGLSPRELHL
jgi:hypothetical protein